jgi:hypothetical protein
VLSHERLLCKGERTELYITELRICPFLEIGIIYLTSYLRIGRLYSKGKKNVDDKFPTSHVVGSHNLAR